CLELHAVRVGKIHGVVVAAVVLAGWIEHGHAILFQKGAERADIVAARKLERIVGEADIALAILVLPPLRVGGGDPEQGLAVAPPRHVRVVVFALEAEEDEQLVVEILRAGEIADAQHEMIDTDDTRHWTPPNAL